MKLADAAINSDFFVSFVAMGLGLAAYVVYPIPFSDLTPLAIIFLITLSVYAINRQTDQEADEINLPERTGFVRRYGKAITAFSILGLFAALALAFIRSEAAGAVSLLAFLCGFFYSYPFPGLGRFKDFLVVKNIGVGLIYGFLALITPAYFGLLGWDVLASLFTLFFIRFFLISSFFDLRDVEGDRKAGLRTIPIALGRSQAILAFQELNLLPLLIFAPLLPLGVVGPPFLLLCLLTTLYGSAYLTACGRGMDMKFLCMVVADAEVFAVASLMALAKCLGLF